MLIILLSFCAGAAAALAAVVMAARLVRAHDADRRAASESRLAALRAEVVDDEMRALLGAPARPYFTAEAVAEARRALEPVVLIRVKP